MTAWGQCHTECLCVLQVERGFRAVHLRGAELVHMGQQSMGHYPVHFHMNGDVDQRGGYDPPSYVQDLSIHHTFSRCVTIHSSNGLLVSLRPHSRLLALGEAASSHTLMARATACCESFTHFS